MLMKVTMKNNLFLFISTKNPRRMRKTISRKKRSKKNNQEKIIRLEFLLQFISR